MWVVFSCYFVDGALSQQPPPTPARLSCQDSADKNVGCFVTVPEAPKNLFIFFSLFSLLFRLGNFYCSRFQFVGSLSLFSILLLGPSTKILLWVIVSMRSSLLTPGQWCEFAPGSESFLSAPPGRPFLLFASTEQAFVGALSAPTGVSARGLRCT